LERKETDVATPATAGVVKLLLRTERSSQSVNTGSVIVKPRITEKAALLGEKNVYTFEVKKGANKVRGT
jgi:hypothetical protein